MALAAVAGGLVILVCGGEFLVSGAVRLARRLGMSSLLIGLTVVAFGTSMPELFVSLTAALEDHVEIMVGNVVGSNIANIGLILALLGLLRPIEVPWERLWGEVRILLMVTGLAIVLALFPRGYNFVDGCILLLGMALFLRHYFLDTQRNRKDLPARPQGEEDRPRELFLSVILVLGGLALLVAGATILVKGARTMAGLLGVAEDVVGATMVAVGTSLPELAASIVALLRGEQEIGVGNILGSNIFNLLFVLGITAVAGGNAIPYNPSTTGMLLTVMALFTLVSIPILKRHGRVERPEAALLLVGYLVFSVLVYYR